MKIDLLIAEERAKHRSDPKFMGGLQALRRAEAALESGQISSYRVLYCEDDPEVVDSVLLDGKK